jgi:hypothetical protein
MTIRQKRHAFVGIFGTASAVPFDIGQVDPSICDKFHIRLLDEKAGRP